MARAKSARRDDRQPAALLVRPARAADARAIASIHVRAWREAYRGLMPAALLRGLSVTGREAAWRGKLREGSSHVLVAEGAGRLVGWIAVGSSRDPDAPEGTGELRAIHVDPRAWRCGAGRALWSAGAAQLRAAGHRVATLWVLEENRRARQFYEALGFVVDGDHRKMFEQGGARLPEVRMRGRL